MSQRMIHSLQPLEARCLLAGVTAGDDQIVFAASNNKLSVANADGTGKFAIPLSNFIDAVSPAFLPDRKSIVFAAAAPNENNPREIYRVGLDGKNLVRLTTNNDLDEDPHVSPDGTRILFATERDLNAEIYVMGIDGSNPTNLTKNAGSDVDPQWSPDGTKIIFSSDRGGNYDIYTMDAATGANVTRLTKSSASDRSPALSPEGQRIVFTSLRRNGHPEIWEMNAIGELQGAKPIRLSTNNNFQAGDTEPVFSPDGMRIAFSKASIGSSYVSVISADSGAGVGALEDDSGFAQSPDWATVARFSGLSNGVVTLVGTAGADRIVVGDLDDNNNLPLTLNGKVETFPFALIQEVQVFCGAGADKVDASQTPEIMYVSGDSGDDTLVGGVNNDTITGGAGRNRIYGGEGDDRMNGSGGRDFLYGEGGNDRMYGNGGNDYMLGGGNVDRMWGGTGDDFLAGNGQNDKLFGEAGNDEIYGHDGNDVFIGGPGADTLNGGKGSDQADNDNLDVRIAIETVV